VTSRLSTPAPDLLAPVPEVSSRRAAIRLGGRTLALAALGAALLAGGVSPVDAATTQSSWTTIGSMPRAAGWHVDPGGIRLADGTVLVEGGESSNGAASTLSTAAIENPATNRWQATGSMSTGRDWHTATLLGDGTVLVTGGFASTTSVLSSAEVYRPSTGTWAATGSMTAARGGHSAVRLADGRVLIIGGWAVYGDDPQASAEIYDPATGTFTATGSMNLARATFMARLLSDGRVLVAGGYVEGGSIQQSASAEIYDPLTGTWTLAQSMNDARTGATATVLADHTVLVVGGENDAAGYLNGAEIFDPSTGAWHRTGAMHSRRAFAATALLPGGRVLAAGGYGPTAGGSADQSSVEVYDPVSGTWTTTKAMRTARDHLLATTLTSGQVLVTGGFGAGGAALSSSEVFKG
jgi:hypothetical protein